MSTNLANWLPNDLAPGRKSLQSWWVMTASHLAETPKISSKETLQNWYENQMCNVVNAISYTSFWDGYYWLYHIEWLLKSGFHVWFRKLWGSISLDRRGMGGTSRRLQQNHFEHGGRLNRNVKNGQVSSTFPFSVGRNVSFPTAVAVFFSGSIYGHVWHGRCGQGWAWCRLAAERLGGSPPFS